MSAPVVIITRAAIGARKSAQRIEELGLTPIVSSAISLHLVEPVPEIPEIGENGVLFTSANGVRFFTEVSPIRDCQAWCVGPSTAAAAQEAGFKKVWNADGDSEALADLVIENAKPSGGSLVHIANTAAGDVLQQKLIAAGFEVKFVGLYEPKDVEPLSEQVVQHLTNDEPVCVLIPSAKGAEAFARKVDGLELVQHTFICVSHKAAYPIKHLGKVRVAARPNEASLMQRVNAWKRAL